MNYTFVVNGVAQLVLIPETELDRLLLDKALDGGGSVEIEKLSQPAGILGKPVTGGYLLKRKLATNQSTITVEDDSSKT